MPTRACPAHHRSQGELQHCLSWFQESSDQDRTHHSTPRRSRNSDLTVTHSVCACAARNATSNRGTHSDRCSTSTSLACSASHASLRLDGGSAADATPNSSRYALARRTQRLCTDTGDRAGVDQGHHLPRATASSSSAHMPPSCAKCLVHHAMPHSRHYPTRRLTHRLNGCLTSRLTSRLRNRHGNGLSDHLGIRQLSCTTYRHEQCHGTCRWRSLAPNVSGDVLTSCYHCVAPCLHRNSRAYERPAVRRSVVAYGMSDWIGYGRRRSDACRDARLGLWRPRHIPGHPAVCRVESAGYTTEPCA